MLQKYATQARQVTKYVTYATKYVTQVTKKLYRSLARRVDMTTHCWGSYQS